MSKIHDIKAAARNLKELIDENCIDGKMFVVQHGIQRWSAMEGKLEGVTIKCDSITCKISGYDYPLDYCYLLQEEAEFAVKCLLENEQAEIAGAVNYA